MRQTELFTDTSSLYDNLCDIHYLHEGFRLVRQNKGSPGVDEVTISDFESRLDVELRNENKITKAFPLSQKFPGIKK